MHVSEVLDDLLAEQAALDAVVAAMTDDQWDLPTPSPRWSITDQIGHLTFFDRTAAMAIARPDEFVAHREHDIAKFSDPVAGDEFTLGEFRRATPTERIARWRAGRDELEAAGSTLTDQDRVEWYGPSMGSKSFLTARLMEVFAHGQDVIDTLAAATGRPAGELRSDTDRLVHIAQLGVITRGWSYIVRGQVPPDAPVRVALTAPSGAVWQWGPADAADSVTGPAGDFCRVVTQRRHVADTDLVVVGDAAADWMDKAQAFAGADTDGPAPRDLRPPD